VRIALLTALLAAPLLGGGWIWLRSSPLVAVEQVRVSGLHGADAQQIDAALTAAARRMSTLDVNRSALREAVASFPVVSSLKVSTSFPHSLRIEVSEQLPVAAIDVEGVRTAVAADGVVLGPAHLAGSLPVLAARVLPSPGKRVSSSALLGELSVIGAAPAPLAKQLQSAYSGSKGVTLVLRGGLRAYFGDATRVHAKWASLASVIADSSSAGASYIDVRLPERPAAGFAPGVTPPGTAEDEEQGTTTTNAGSESSEALAEGLEAAVGGRASTAASPSSPSTSEASSSGASQTSPSGGEEAVSGAGASAAAGGGGQ
jgi:cell division protein FtsQ